MIWSQAQGQLRGFWLRQNDGRWLELNLEVPLPASKRRILRE